MLFYPKKEVIILESIYSERDEEFIDDIDYIFLARINNIVETKREKAKFGILD